MVQLIGGEMFKDWVDDLKILLGGRERVLEKEWEESQRGFKEELEKRKEESRETTEEWRDYPSIVKPLQESPMLLSQMSYDFAVSKHNNVVHILIYEEGSIVASLPFGPEDGKLFVAELQEALVSLSPTSCSTEETATQPDEESW